MTAPCILCQQRPARDGDYCFLCADFARRNERPADEEPEPEPVRVVRVKTGPVAHCWCGSRGVQHERCRPRDGRVEALCPRGHSGSNRFA